MRVVPEAKNDGSLCQQEHAQHMQSPFQAASCQMEDNIVLPGRGRAALATEPPEIESYQPEPKQHEAAPIPLQLEEPASSDASDESDHSWDGASSTAAGTTESSSEDADSDEEVMGPVDAAGNGGNLYLQSKTCRYVPSLAVSLG